MVFIEEVPAFKDVLLESTHEQVLIILLNEAFGDIDEGTDELLETLEDELREYLQRVIEEGISKHSTVSH
ncbi:hypothetical protein ACQ5SI_18610 [Peribacillus frigoritolerans]|uniref:hypothetical protein n=1 Tax=Peribacillus frigoritolerans TaxID=450367 RepID=UPI003D34ADCC